MRLARSAVIIAICLLGQAGLSADARAPAAARGGKAHSASSKRNNAFVNNHFVLGKYMKMNGYHSGDPTVVVVDKGSHFTHVLQLQDRGVVRVLTLSNSIGSKEKPTPPGRYTVAYKKEFPEWIPPKTIDPKQKHVKPYNEDKKNPLGVAAIYLDKYDLDLHGTNDPRNIRKSISHGCVRHSNADISQLYGMVRPGTPVYIVRRFSGTVLNKSDFGARSIAGK